MRKQQSRKGIYLKLLASPKISSMRLPICQLPPVRSTYRSVSLSKLPVLSALQPKPTEQVPTEQAHQLPLLQTTAKPTRKKLPPIALSASKREDIRETLLSIVKGPPPNAMDWVKYTSYQPFALEHSLRFLHAVKAQDYDAVKNLLVVSKKLLTTVDSTGATALHWAVKRKDDFMTELLLRAGADVDCRDMVLRTPLYLAVRQQLSRVVRLLLEAGASPTAESLDGSSPLSVAKGALFEVLQQAASKAGVVQEG